MQRRQSNEILICRLIRHSVLDNFRHDGMEVRLLGCDYSHADNSSGMGCGVLGDSLVRKQGLEMVIAEVGLVVTVFAALLVMINK